VVVVAVVVVVVVGWGDGWLVGWLVGWLAGWLVVVFGYWLAGCQAGFIPSKIAFSDIAKRFKAF